MGTVKKPKRKRTELIAFYVTEREKEMIVKNAFEKDQTISDYCRKTLANMKTVEERDYVREDT